MDTDIASLPLGDIEARFLKALIARSREWSGVERDNSYQAMTAVLALEAQLDRMACIYMPRVRKGWTPSRARLPRAEMRAWLIAQMVKENLERRGEITPAEIQRQSRRFEFCDELAALLGKAA